jgi:hypothetical protein
MHNHGQIHSIEQSIVCSPHAGITPLHKLGKRKEFRARHQVDSESLLVYGITQCLQPPPPAMKRAFFL